MPIGAASIRSLALLLALGLPGVARAEAPTRAGFVSFLFDLGLAEEAALEVRRLDELGAAGTLAPGELMRLGTALAEQGRGAPALFVLGLAAAAEGAPEEVEGRRLALAVAMLRSGAAPMALQLLGRLEAFGASPALRARARWLGCIGQVHARNAAAATGCIRALVGEDPEAEPLLDDLSVDPELRARIGGVLSALVPGLGQLTGGDPADAALALAVNGAWMAGVVLLASHGLALDAGLLGAGFGLRYYLGNVHHGADAWRARAERERQAAAERLMRLLGRRAAESQVSP